MASFVLQLAAITRIRRLCRWPGFTTFLIISSVGSCGLFFLRGSRSYVQVWAAYEVVLTVFKILALWEAYRLSVSAYKVAGWYIWRIPIALGLALTSLALIMTLTEESLTDQRITLSVAMVFGMRTVILSSCAFLLISSTLFSLTPAPTAQNVVLHRNLLIAYLAGESVAYFVAVSGGGSLNIQANLFLHASAVICFAWWAFGLTKSGQHPAAPAPLSAEERELLESRAAQIRRFIRRLHAQVLSQQSGPRAGR